MTSLSEDDLLWMYRVGILSRAFEDKLAEVYFEGKLPPHIQKGLAFDIAGGPIPGEMHLAAGQEAAAMGMCLHLQPGDTVWASHRAHHFAIARGVPLDRMTAEIFGKVTGLCRGKGGHMHLYDMANGFASNGIVGAGIPHACGAALAAKLSGRRAVAVAEFGDGAANQGAFHEALNLAGLWKLPVIFVCQDNGYGISVSRQESTAVASNADRAAGYAMPGIRVDSGRPEDMAIAGGDAVARARAGEGPTLIEIVVPRFYGHYQGDAEAYRPKNEVAVARAADPLFAYEARLLAMGVIDTDALGSLREEVDFEVSEAMRFGRESPYPDRAEAFEHVFAPCGDQIPLDMPAMEKGL